MINKFVHYVKNLGAARPLPSGSGWDPAKEKMAASPKDASFEEIFGAGDMTGKPSKDHRKWRAKDEKQQWSDCVTFSHNNVQESKARAAGVTDEEGRELNFSDLELAEGSGTTRNGGNSLKNVAERARTIGMVLERVAPYQTSWDERIKVYNAVPKDAKRYKTSGYQTIGLTRNSLKNALEFSTGIQVGAGLGETYRNSGVITPPKEVTVYHAMKCDYIDAEGKMYCQDHYSRTEVILSADYPIMVAMAFADMPADWRGITDDTAKFYQRMIGKLIMRVEENGEVYRVEENRMRYIAINISDADLMAKFHDFQREKKNILGVSEKDFQRLAGHIIKVGKGVIKK